MKSHGTRSLAEITFEATKGDSLLALAMVCDMVKAEQVRFNRLGAIDRASLRLPKVAR